MQNANNAGMLAHHRAMLEVMLKVWCKTHAGHGNRQCGNQEKQAPFTG